MNISRVTERETKILRVVEKLVEQCLVQNCKNCHEDFDEQFGKHLIRLRVHVDRKNERQDDICCATDAGVVVVSSSPFLGFRRTVICADFAATP